MVLGTAVVDERAADAPLLEQGFYNRRRASHGQFIAPEQLEGRRMSHASALFPDVSSVTVRRAAGQTVLLARNTAGYCALDVWVDGYYTPLLASLSFDDVVNVDHR